MTRDIALFTSPKPRTLPRAGAAFIRLSQASISIFGLTGALHNVRHGQAPPLHHRVAEPAVSGAWLSVTPQEFAEMYGLKPRDVTQALECHRRLQGQVSE